MGYLQSAYQPDEAVDLDPGSEIGPDAAIGWTVGDISYVFAEGIVEQNAWLRFLPPDDFSTAFREANQRCTGHVLAHEVGHQLGLGVNHKELGGVMFENCAIADKYFTGQALSLIRGKGGAR